jgi:hypothetical protein
MLPRLNTNTSSSELHATDVASKRKSPCGILKWSGSGEKTVAGVTGDAMIIA